jgi:4'-phosphopantetheinyl transferase
MITLLIEDTTGAGWEAHLTSLLSDTEQRRAQTFRFSRDRDSYVAAHAALAILLSTAGLSPLEDWKLGYDARGRPRIEMRDTKRPCVEVSISHSGTSACATLSLSGMPGVDIETSRSWSDDHRSLASYFHRAEQSYFVHCGETPEAFFHLWTRKEAVSKAVGRGLALDFQQFDCLPDSLTLDGQTYQLRSVRHKDIFLSIALGASAGAVSEGKISIARNVSDMLSDDLCRAVDILRAVPDRRPRIDMARNVC